MPPATSRKINWNAVGGIVAALALLLSLIGGMKAWLLMPHQVDALQRQVNDIVLDAKKDRKEILEEVKDIRDELDLGDRLSVAEERLDKHDERLDDDVFRDWTRFRVRTEDQVEKNTVNIEENGEDIDKLYELYRTTSH